jgi:hypothetical protein
MTNYLVPKCYVRQLLNYWLYGELDCIAGRMNISSHHHLNFQKVCKNLFSVPFWIYCVWKECILVAMITTHHTSTLISCNSIMYISLELSVIQCLFKYFCSCQSKSVQLSNKWAVDQFHHYTLLHRPN